MATGSIPVDLLNPGQVFACLGLMELSEALCGHTRVGFDWSNPSETRFVVAAAGDRDPIREALEFLARAKVEAMVTVGALLDTSKWKVPVHKMSEGAPYPIPEPEKPAMLPAIVGDDSVVVVISSWGDGRLPNLLSSGRDNVKFWAGSGGYPGAALVRDALDLIRDLAPDARNDPLNASAAQSSSFRLDWRRDYIPIDIGFSLNEHTAIQPRGYPITELLAVIGLSHARPRREAKLRYRYGVVGLGDARQFDTAAFLPPLLMRAALGAADLPFPTRIFTMNLDWPGQEGQARCITTVTEDAQ